MAAKRNLNIVFLSGLLCDNFVWETIIQQLHPGYFCRVFSFAGFNSIEAMAAAVVKQCAAPCVVVGHSMGGRVALEVLRQAPKLVSHLALFNTGVHPKAEQEVAGREALLALAENQGMLAVAEQWLPPMLSQQARQNKSLVAALTAMITRHSSQDFRGQIQALLNRPNAETVLETIRVPTLLMSGEEDTWSPPEQHIAMQANIQHSEFHRFDKTGHMATVEQPLALVKLIEDWLSRNPRITSA